MNADGSGLRIVARVERSTPAWSPDGRRIAFETDRPLRRERRRQRQRRLRAGNLLPGRPTGADRVRDYRKLYVVNADGSGHRTLTRLIGDGRR